MSLCPSSLSGSVPSLLRRHSLAGAGTAPASLAEVGAGLTRQAVEPVVNLRLGELQHIRSVLGKAKLEVRLTNEPFNTAGSSAKHTQPSPPNLGCRHSYFIQAD